MLIFTDGESASAAAADGGQKEEEAEETTYKKRAGNLNKNTSCSPKIRVFNKKNQIIRVHEHRAPLRWSGGAGLEDAEFAGEGGGRGGVGEDKGMGGGGGGRRRRGRGGKEEGWNSFQ